jgi:hypothetical protein
MLSPAQRIAVQLRPHQQTMRFPPLNRHFAGAIDCASLRLGSFKHEAEVTTKVAKKVPSAYPEHLVRQTCGSWPQRGGVIEERELPGVVLDELEIHVDTL